MGGFFPGCSLHQARVCIQMAAANAPQAWPLKPMPPANPATVIASSSPAPICLATSVAQLIACEDVAFAGNGLADARVSASSAAANASGAH